MLKKLDEYLKYEKQYNWFMKWKKKRKNINKILNIYIYLKLN